MIIGCWSVVSGQWSVIRGQGRSVGSGFGGMGALRGVVVWAVGWWWSGREVE